tara:strand:- start:1676 stop:2089 length:414 start_codon:yes stop_codon:yes gene_type:complete
MPTTTARDRFYGPLRRVAHDYLPLLLGRMRILEARATKAMEYLEAEADQDHEFIWVADEADRIAQVAEAQTDLHKSVLEAGTCQQLVGAFIELLQDDYSKIRDNGCFYMDPEGQLVSLYDVQHQAPPNDDDEGVKSR